MKDGLTYSFEIEQEKTESWASALSRELRIAYLAKSIRNDPNRVQYQRPKCCLAKENKVFIFAGKNVNLCDQQDEHINLINAPFDFMGVFSILYPLWCFLKVQSSNREFAFHIVYSNYDFLSVAAGFGLKLLGFKWVIDIWDHPELPLELWRNTAKDLKRVLSFPLYAVGVQFSRIVLKYADFIVLAMHPEILEDINLPSSKILQVTNGVDQTITKPQGIRKRTDTSFKIIYVGYVTRSRGIDTLIDAVAILKHEIDRVKLTLVGDITKADEQHLNEIVRKDHLIGNIEVLGRVKHKEVLSLTRQADVCVLPFPRKKELDYIYPVKIFEYMALGKAIVATGLCGVSEVLRNGKDGLIVQPESPTEMAEALLEIHTNPKLRNELEKNVVQTARKYRWDKINQKIAQEIRRLFG